ncbi:MarC family protein [Asticcacaulis sp. SL142]|uniref:MarC family protein n=1 Tax=Asticcacaulis sp. SL142 TaxID=2995155 RepID=UPI00226D1AC0|nr:MarC family protein [Asticcacaulis sp. SL142]WAC47339.1 MarC family protein [Asticcacaulis sp. SL142]
MNLVEFYVNFFITLFALLDPIGNVPIFAAATRSHSKSTRKWLTFYIAIFSALFLSFFFFTGLKLLQFFGISMDAFRIAGGILLFLLGLDMTRGDFLAMFEEVEHVNEKPDADKQVKILTGRASANISFEKLVVPFAIPLLIGPGAISTVIIQAGEAQKYGWAGMLVGLGAILSTAVAIFLTFFFTGTISKLLGRVGMVVVIRVLGLILCALAIQIIISSLSVITQDIITPAAAHPYATAHGA